MVIMFLGSTMMRFKNLAQKYIIQHEQTKDNGDKIYSLQHPSRPLTENEKKQPVTKEDIALLGEKLSPWPPEFTRDENLKRLDMHRQSLADVTEDRSMSNLDKIMEIGHHINMMNLYKNKYFNDHASDFTGTQQTKPVAPLPVQPVQETPSLVPAHESDLKRVARMLPKKKLSMTEALISVPAHRKQVAQHLLSKLGSKGLLDWDSSGQLIIDQRKQPGTNIQELMRYFESDVANENPPRGFRQFMESVYKLQGGEAYLIPSRRALEKEQAKILQLQRRKEERQKIIRKRRLSDQGKAVKRGRILMTIR